MHNMDIDLIRPYPKEEAGNKTTQQDVDNKIDSSTKNPGFLYAVWYMMVCYGIRLEVGAWTWTSFNTQLPIQI